MTIEAMKQALEALETCMYPQQKQIQAITSLRQAIEQAEKQEPVAWMDGYRNIYSLEEKAAGCEDAVIPLVPAIQHWSDCAVHNEPAYPKGDCDCGGYTIPQPQREWVGLTDEEIGDLKGGYQSGRIGSFVELTQAIEAKLKEKNT